MYYLLLHRLLWRDGIITVTYLLEHCHCDPNCVTIDGKSPLDVVKKPEHLLLLLKHGPDWFRSPCRHSPNNIGKEVIPWSYPCHFSFPATSRTLLWCLAIVTIANNCWVSYHKHLRYNNIIRVLWQTESPNNYSYIWPQHT